MQYKTSQLEAAPQRENGVSERKRDDHRSRVVVVVVGVTHYQPFNNKKRIAHIANVMMPTGIDEKKHTLTKTSHNKLGYAWKTNKHSSLQMQCNARLKYQVKSL